ncbi:dUTP diphosphatase [Heyndrickxia ginsengihumi]|uniref:dUTP diphosphatase n=1 Tax=Heyndrickxia ginsengihumi TaxID=363870 RepID=UPI003D1EEFAB
MNLQKLFEAQAELDKHIIEKKGLQGVDLLPNLILALQVELGECANEWRGFKHWSEDQNPRYSREEWKIVDDAKVISKFNPSLGTDINYAAVEIVESKPLLEEYVDCLHFILSIGNYLGLQNYSPSFSKVAVNFNGDELLAQWDEIFRAASTFKSFHIQDADVWYSSLFSNFLGLGEMLGFTWKQIEQAYFEKNEVNHQRQESGY